MTMTISATVDPERSRMAAHTSGSQPIILDADAPEGYGTETGPRELLLVALAGCTAMDVASILRKKRQSASTYEVTVSAESADEHPRIFTAITVEHRVTGDVVPEAVRRSVELSATKYCPVSAMLSKSVVIEHRYRLVDASGVEHEALVAVTGPEGARVVA